MRVSIESAEVATPTSTTSSPPPASPTPSPPAGAPGSTPPFHQVLSQQGATTPTHGVTRADDSATPATPDAAKRVKAKARAHDRNATDTAGAPAAPIQTVVLAGPDASRSAPTSPRVRARASAPAAKGAPVVTGDVSHAGRATLLDATQGSPDSPPVTGPRGDTATPAPRDAPTSVGPSGTAKSGSSEPSRAPADVSADGPSARPSTVSPGTVELERTPTRTPVREQRGPATTARDSTRDTRSASMARASAPLRTHPGPQGPATPGPSLEGHDHVVLDRGTGASSAQGPAAHATTLPVAPTRATRTTATPDPASASASVPPGATQPPAPAVGVGGAGAPAGVSTAAPHAVDVGLLAGAIARPLSDGQGTYRVLVAMHPADLGQMQAVVTLHGNDLQVLLTPHTGAGHDALAGALHTLKGELSRGGMNVNVTLRDPSSQSPQHHEPRRSASPAATLPETGSVVSSGAPPTHTGQIHIVL